MGVSNSIYLFCKCPGNILQMPWEYLTVSVSVANVLGHDAVLEEEEVVPLRGTGPLRLGSPERPPSTCFKAVYLGQEELLEKLLVLGGKAREVGVIVLAYAGIIVGRDVVDHVSAGQVLLALGDRQRELAHPRVQGTRVDVVLDIAGVLQVDAPTVGRQSHLVPVPAKALVVVGVEIDVGVVGEDPVELGVAVAGNVDDDLHRRVKVFAHRSMGFWVEVVNTGGPERPTKV